MHGSGGASQGTAGSTLDMINSPVFVVGSSRSGTTMIGRVLNQHSAIRTFPELHFFEQLCESGEMASVMDRQDAERLMDRLIGIMEEGFLHYRRGGTYLPLASKWIEELGENLTPCSIFSSFLKRFANAANATHACDQTPRNVLFIPDILNAYPDARVICMVRDPRAVLSSQKRKWKRKFLGASTIPWLESARSYFNYHPYTISKLWVATVNAIERSKADSRVLVLKYENVVSDPRRWVGEICEFLGVDFEEAMLLVPHIGSSSRSDLAVQECGISKASLSDSYEGVLRPGEIFICEKVAGASMRRYGYAPAHCTSTPFLELTAYALIFPIKMGIAIAFNWRRMRNVRESIVRRLRAA
jgi:hypothetical protein